MMNKQVWDKLDGQTIPQNSVIQVFTFAKQQIQNRTILVLSRPPRIIYRETPNRIGQPKDYENIKKDGFPDSCPNDIKIPLDVLAKNGIDPEGNTIVAKEQQNYNNENIEEATT